MAIQLLVVEKKGKTTLWSYALLAWIWYLPVMYTHHSIFNKIRQHDDCSTLPITDDFPHVSDGGGHWTLCYDVSLLLLIGLL